MTGKNLLGEFCWTVCLPTWEVLQRGKPHGPEVLVTWRFGLELKIVWVLFVFVFVITFAGRALAMSTASLETSAAEASPRDDRQRSVRKSVTHIEAGKNKKLRMIFICLAKVSLAPVSSSWIVE